MIYYIITPFVNKIKTFYNGCVKHLCKKKGAVGVAFGLYLHIPYCLAKCRYCDFYSRGASRGVPEEYVAALERAIAGFYARENLPAPGTVYLGGGTPSLLSPRPGGAPAGRRGPRRARRSPWRQTPKP